MIQIKQNFLGNPLSLTEETCITQSRFPSHFNSARIEKIKIYEKYCQMAFRSVLAPLPLFLIIIIWNPGSNISDADLEDSACKVPVLLFFLIILTPIEKILEFWRLQEQQINKIDAAQISSVFKIYYQFENKQTTQSYSNQS